MSLLMDALKKAELAKRQGAAPGISAAAEEPKEASGLMLEPLSTQPMAEAEPAATEPARELPIHDAPEHTPAAASALPDLSAHLEQLDADFLAAARQQTARRTTRTSPVVRDAPAPAAQGQTAKDPAAAPPRPTAKQDQATVQNVFTAKQPVPAPRKNFALAAGGGTLLALIAIGGYFWWQLQPQSGLAAHPAVLGTNAPPPQPPSLPVPAVTPPSAVLAAPSTQAAKAIRPAYASSADDRQEDKEDGQNSIATKTRRRHNAELASPDSRDETVHLTRAPLRVDPSLMRGFDAFNRGDLAVARIEYERALKSDPRNTDALHGLAAVALSQGQAEQAEWLYQQVLEANPQDPAAQAALINIRGQADPVAAETRLKTLAAEQPELAAPHFALGNLYARQKRWGEAQSAYFRAWNTEPDNPDILYNLAISLEHLHQTRLAIQYYGQAIAAANTRPASFDKSQAAARLRALQP